MTADHRTGRGYHEWAAAGRAGQMGYLIGRRASVRKSNAIELMGQM